MRTILEFIFPSIFAAVRGEGYQAAIKDILVFKDKIYTQPVTLVGDGHSLVNVTCLGNDVGVKIVSSGESAPELH